jgi:hypothetical protein
VSCIVLPWPRQCGLTFRRVPCVARSNAS